MVCRHPLNFHAFVLEGQCPEWFCGLLIFFASVSLISSFMIFSLCYDFLVQLVRPRLWDCSKVALHYQWINLEHLRPGVQMKGTTYLY